MSTPDDGKRQRRPHRKSRLGCQQCKKRKIKCDEAKPVCLNCVQRGVECSFMSRDQKDPEPESTTCSCRCSASLAHVGGPHRGDSSTWSDRIPDGLQSVVADQAMSLQTMSRRLALLEAHMQQLKRAEPSPVLIYADMGLFHHYFVMTTLTESEEESGGHFWRVQLPEMGLRQPHVLHLLLGFAALHKARSMVPDQRAELFVQAHRHHAIGMQGAAKLLGTLNDDNFEVVYTSALLIGLHNLALGPQPGEYIGFSDRGRASFMILLRGVRYIRCHGEDDLPSDTPSDSDEAAQSCVSTAPPDSAPSVDYGTHLQSLRDLVLTSPSSLDPKSRDLYLTALDELQLFFAAAYGDIVSNPRAQAKADAYSRVPFAWLYRASDGYIDRLEAKEPLALIIFACFSAILKELETGWTLQGWPEHIMSGVWKFLGLEHRKLVQWPMERIGWDPL